MQSLVAEGFTVLLETSGERGLAAVPSEVHKIVDVKCPSSGEAGRFRLENLGALSKRDEVKFVLASREDYDFAVAFAREHGLDEIAGEVIFSPAFRKDARGSRDAANCLVDPKELAEWMLADNIPARLGFQIHKFIWEPQTREV
jgi:7-carboxy-7-deazaguanine synthase